MSGRIRVSKALGRRQLAETLLSPGYYIMLAVGLALGCLLAAGFANSVDSSGFNPQASPVYELVTRSLAGAFGGAFVEKLFSEGPFLFALLAGFLPVFAYLAIASVLRFGQEKNAGVMELVAYGPADGGAYLFAVFVKDLVLSALSLAVLAAALLAVAALTNMSAGPMFFWSLAALFLVSLAFFSYGILCSTLMGSSSSAIALFLGICIVFFLVLAGTFTIVSAPVRTLSSVAGAVLSWMSPLFYAGIFYRSVQAASPGGTVSGLVLLAVLTAILLGAGQLVIDRKGVRA